MARTDVATVRKIIDTELSDSVIDAYIDSANLTITEVFENDSTLSSDFLAVLEQWLSAHLLSSTRERQFSKAAGGNASIEYTPTGVGLQATLYGQQVISMDTTGRLAALSGKRASMSAVSS